jgi:hypothetical protein
MKDAFGQERTPVQTREAVIAAMFALVVGVALWSVAIPALDESRADKDTPDSAKAATEENAEPSPQQPATP